MRMLPALMLGSPLGLAATVLTLQVVRLEGSAITVVWALASTVSAALMLPLVPVRSRRPGAMAVAPIGALGLLLPALVTSWAPGRLLRGSPAAQLAWMLGEEDNAHVVGVARELLEVGPGGAELATQYGTSFAGPGVALLRSGVIGPMSGDPRLDAITATTAAAAMLPLVIATALVLAAAGVRSYRAVPSAVGPPTGAGAAQPDVTAWRSHVLLRALGLSIGSLAAGTAVQLLGVAVPMQLGFATLAWSVAWALVGWAAVVNLHARDLPAPTRLALGVQLGASVILLEGSWPFLIGAVLLPGLLVVRRVLGGDASTVHRVRLDRRKALLVAALGAAIASVALGSGAVRAVLSLGRAALTAGIEVGASIIAIGPALHAVTVIAAGAVLLSLRRRGPSVVVASAAAGALATLGVVWLASVVVADGVVGYGARKLMLAGAMLAVSAVAAVLASGRLAGWGPAITAAVLSLILLDPLGRLSISWWERTASDEPPHAVATITAIRGSSPDLPIRCRPEPGTPATAASKLAAYFCIVWMEDAFNSEPSSGNRFAFFQTEAPTFDEALLEAEEAGLYGFAYPHRLGPGWFGWDGRS